MRVLLTHPEWSRSCDDCEKFIYDDEGRQSKRAGLPVLRPKGTVTPCHKCPKIPAGADPVRANAIEATEQHLQAYEHFMECRAVGKFPKDPIVRRNAKIFRAILDEIQQRPLLTLIHMLGLRNG